MVGGIAGRQRGAPRVSTPLLHLLAGPNGSGKSTFAERLLVPITHLPFINADLIAARRWPGHELDHAYEASRLAAEERSRLIDERASFITETVFSHDSKVALVRTAVDRGYAVTLHVMLVSPDVAVARVAERVGRGGHDVPEGKVRERHARLWPLLARASGDVDRTVFYDNSCGGSPFRIIGTKERGRWVGAADWPAWAPDVLR